MYRKSIIYIFILVFILVFILLITEAIYWNYTNIASIIIFLFSVGLFLLVKIKFLIFNSKYYDIWTLLIIINICFQILASSLSVFNYRNIDNISNNKNTYRLTSFNGENHSIIKLHKCDVFGVFCETASLEPLSPNSLSNVGQWKLVIDPLSDKISIDMSAAENDE